MIHDVFIMGTNRICWRYCQGEKRGSAQRLHGPPQEWVRRGGLWARTSWVAVGSDARTADTREGDLGCVLLERSWHL